MPPVGFEPTISAGERPHVTHLHTEYTEHNIHIISRIKLLGIPWHVVKDFAINGFREKAYRDLT